MNHNGAFADFLNNYMSEKVKDNNCEDDSESEHDTKDLKLTQTNKVEKTYKFLSNIMCFYVPS
jgi:hypothetical protein